MGSPATTLAAETELAETMTEPTTGVGGRSVDWTLSAAGTGASPMAASSAPRPDENAIQDYLTHMCACRQTAFGPCTTGYIGLYLSKGADALVAGAVIVGLA